jgi:hypothetical protein
LPVCSAEPMATPPPFTLTVTDGDRSTAGSRPG